jgi:hypothetical protein
LVLEGSPSVFNIVIMNCTAEPLSPEKAALAVTGVADGKTSGVNPGTHIGVVGHLPDLTQEQRADFKRILTNITRSNPPPFVLHHGYSQGSDEVVHEIVRALGGWQIHGHPGYDDHGPGPRSKGDLDVIHDSKPLAERNAEIADASRILVVIPPDREDGPETDQPGFWTTIHKARDAGRTIFHLAQPGRRKKNRSQIRQL